MTEIEDAQVDDTRKRAIDRLKAKRAFWATAGSGVVALVIATAIWVISGEGYYWPIWIVFGIALALIGSGWRIWGPARHGITEDEIRREMDRSR